METEATEARGVICPVDLSGIEELRTILGRTQANGGRLCHEVICPHSELSGDVEDQDTHIPTLVDRLKSHQRILSVLQTQLESSLEIARKASNGRCLRGTITGLPEEVLILIFQQIPDCDRTTSPSDWTRHFITASHVCRCFRSIVLSKPAFWAALSVRDAPAKTLACKQRSASPTQGIAVDLTCSTVVGKGRSHQETFLVMLQGSSHRWDAVYCDADAASALMKHWPNATFPRLTHLSFEPASTVQDTPFSLRQAQQAAEGLTLFQRPGWLCPRLDTLVLRNTNFTARKTAIGSAIRTCTLSWTVDATTRGGSQRYELYKSLFALVRIAVYTLTELNLHIATQSFADEQGNGPRARMVPFVALTRLTVTVNLSGARGSSFPFLIVLCGLHLPKLRHLDLTFIGVDGATYTRFLKTLPTFRSLRSLAVSRSGSSGGYSTSGHAGSDPLVTLIRRSPLLAHLSLHGKQLIPPWYSAVFATSDASAESVGRWAGLPNLEVAEFKECALVGAAYLRAMLDALQARPSWSAFKRLEVYRCELVSDAKAQEIATFMEGKEFGYSSAK